MGSVDSPRELALLKKLLDTAGSFNQILDFCKSGRPVCQRNRQLLSKKVLELSGYRKFPNPVDYVNLYRNLVRHCKNINGYVRVSDVNLQCRGHLPDSILELFQLNGIGSGIPFYSATHFSVSDFLES